MKLFSNFSHRAIVMKDITKKYSNDDITVVWKPSLCIHSAICFKGLPGVFDPHRRPWIDMSRADTKKIIDQVERCPSGALSAYRNDQNEVPASVSGETIVEVAPNGPLVVYGNLQVKDREGNITQKNKVTAFCRCGQSSNKPYCDGSHTKAGFSG